MFRASAREEHLSGHPTGFTLVELLVVIGIIGMLIAILLPALRKVRQQAMVSACAANLHSIGQTLFTFAADNKGRYPQKWKGDNSDYFRTMYFGTKGRLDVRQLFGADPSYPYNATPWPPRSPLWDGRIWMCPAPDPEKIPYQTIDETRSQGNGFHHHTNYILLWSEPGIDSNGNPIAWGAAPGRTTPRYYKGPTGIKDSARLTIAQDALWISTSDSDNPPTGYGRANHIRGGGGVSGKTGSSQEALETLVFIDTRMAQDVVGANILYNDGHVQLKRPDELVPLQYVVPPNKIVYMDLPPDMGQ